jgi:hypothetical protein
VIEALKELDVVPSTWEEITDRILLSLFSSGENCSNWSHCKETTHLISFLKTGLSPKMEGLPTGMGCPQICFTCQLPE